MLRRLFLCRCKRYFHPSLWNYFIFAKLFFYFIFVTANIRETYHITSIKMDVIDASEEIKIESLKLW